MLTQGETISQLTVVSDNQKQKIYDLKRELRETRAFIESKDMQIKQLKAKLKEVRILRFSYYYNNYIKPNQF